MKLEQHVLPVHAPQNLDLAAGVTHGVAHALADAVLQALGGVHDFYALVQRHLKPPLDPGDRPALENVIGDDLDPRQAAQQLPQRFRAVIDAAQKDCLISHLDPDALKGADRPDGFRVISRGWLNCVTR